MAERRSAEEYYRDKKPRIEAALVDAVRVAVSEKDSDPISRIAQLLQKQRTIPSQTNHKRAVDKALKLYEESKESLGKEGLSQAEIERVQSWKFRQWLDSLKLSSILLQPLLQPLREKERSPGAELPFVHAIGQLEDWTDLFDILTSHDALVTIAKVMWDSARSLWAASVEEKSPTTTPGRSKFADVHLSLGAPSMFFKGLDDFIGPPNPNVREAMTHEHTTHKDSNVDFVAHNYQTKTTSRREWFFVVEPKEGLKKTKLSEWPKEENPPSRDLLDGCEQAGKTNSRCPGPRTPRELTKFEANLNIKNGLLRDLGEEPVTWDEFIGARLYTGPMFQKYNGVLRCIGNVRMKQSGHALTESEIEITLREDTEAKTKGNVYTTTLHVINSACIKLGKLTSAAKVYRGINGRLLPKAMDVANKYNVRGGVEFGFMSATLDRRVAMAYAKGTGEHPALLFEMQMGMIDRGADLSWLSQYPHECEILFAPLSALEVLTQYVDRHVRVIDVRLSVNLQALTIEQVISKMQRSHLQLVDLLQDNMRFAGVPARLLAPLQQLWRKASHQDPSRFNEAVYYRTATNAALDGQNRIFDMITDKNVWAMGGTANTGDEATTPDDQADEMRRTAMLCARVGQHEKAAKLLIMRVRLAEEAHGARAQQPSGAGPCWGLLPPRPLASKGAATVREACEAVACSLIMDFGLSAPWPGTLVALVKRCKLTEDGAGDIDTSKELVQKSQAEGPPLFETPSEIKRGKLTEDGASFIDTIKELVKKSQAERPPLFKPQSEVLALLVDEQIWEHARVRRVRDESTTQIQVIKKGKTLLHNEYDVVSWKERPVIQGHLLTPSVGGPAALLRHAAEKGEVELVGALLEAGVSIYESDALANTALILASKAGHADVCRKLKGAGASEHLRNASRENAYDLANHHKHTEVLRVFKPYSSDADVGKQMAKFEMARNEKTLTRPCELENGVTMLMLACRRGHPKAVQELLEAKADVLAQTRTGCTALMMAAEEGGDAPAEDGGNAHVDVVKMLLKSADGKKSIERQMEKGKKTAIMLAATNGHMRVVELLAEAGADIHVRYQNPKDGKEDDGRTVLHLTCMHGHKDVAEFLLDRGAGMNAVNAQQETPLMLAARYGHLEVIQLLLSRNCNFADETVNSSWSSIHRACGAGHVEVAQVLLEKHPKFVNYTEPKNGLTPLMAAVGANFSETAVVLMDKGADVGMVDGKGGSAVYIAAKAGQEKSLRVLLTHKGVDVNQANYDKETPLMAACKNGHESTARLLLNAKAIFEEEEDQAGLPNNPLMIAAKAGHEPIVRMLLNNGAKKRKEEAAQAAKEALREEERDAGSAQPTTSVEPWSPRLFKKAIEVFRKGAGGSAPPIQPTTSSEFSTAAGSSSSSQQLEQAGPSSTAGGDGPLDRFKKIIELLEKKEEVAKENEQDSDECPPVPPAIAQRR